MADPNDFLDDPEAAEAEAYASEMEEIDEGELALEEVMQERDQYKDRLMRALADAENARKRSDKDRREAENYGGSKLARDMLSVYDNMKRALESATEEQRAVSGPLLEGVDLTMRELLSVFKKHGMEIIEPQVGDRFDPKIHQAMFEAPVPETKAGDIIQVAAEGFMLHDRLLRPAQVGVSSMPG
ncbi:MAG: nucleotide exchange factor GrpE [Sulfitobacter sp.]|jgi:molecular chaperone GrpE|nr:nucleotide exchange factor GrpE [Sulfitobacter sp.]MDG1353504.1 nucleotide exchange factor GrpE [Sulfitobacter sp.]